MKEKLNKKREAKLRERKGDDSERQGGREKRIKEKIGEEMRVKDKVAGSREESE
jgi:hypothetical protein